MSAPSTNLLRHIRQLAAAQVFEQWTDRQLLERFAAGRDEAAFALLVRRHGPMVLGLCRRVLSREQDAEDAFQAAFLLLARKADSIRQTDVGGWLYRVAYHAAVRARAQLRRRQQREQQGEAMSPSDPPTEAAWNEMRQIVDEELQRLPEEMRAALVLCHLEGKTQDEAARLLGWSKGTLRRRLGQGRELLRHRLLRRGLAPATALTASLLDAGNTSATVSAALAGATVRAVLSGPASPAIAALVEAGAALLSVSKVKAATALLFAVSLLGGAGLWACHALTAAMSSAPAQPTAAQADDKPRTAPKREATKTVEIQGRVLDPEGKPKAGAKLLLLAEDGKIMELGVTTADGRFTFVVPKMVQGRGLSPVLLARSGDSGLDFVRLAGLDAAKPVEFRLVKDQVIRGRVVSTEGKPSRGVRVAVTRIDVYPKNSLETFLILWPKRPADHALPGGERTVRFRGPSLLFADTDEEGHFTISGIGVERVAELNLRGAGIADTSLWIGNRSGFDWKPYNRPVDDAYRLAGKMMNPDPLGTVLQGPDAFIIAEPEKPIRGTVKDADSGKGIPNVLVRLQQSPTDVWRNFPMTKTDSHGRYEFRGARKTKTYPFHVDSDSTAGYLATQIHIADTVGYSPLNVDIHLKKGVIVTGKVIDKATGKAVPGFAQFRVLVNNPFAKDYPGLGTQRHDTATDGTFRVVTIPGPVLLMGGYYPTAPTEKFDYIEFSKYQPPIADPEYPQYFTKSPISRRNDTGYLAYRGGIGLLQGNYCKVLDIKPGTATVHQDILLDRASILEVKIQDADGRPTIGVWATDFATHGYIGPLWIERSTCPVYGLEQRKSRLLIFYEPKKKIIVSRKLQGDEKGPLVVKLGAMGATKGRLLDSDGKPLAGFAVTVHYRESEADKMHQLIHKAKQIVTDAAGAFALDELIPERKFYIASLYRRESLVEEGAKRREPILHEVKPGECLDLGAIKLKPLLE